MTDFLPPEREMSRRDLQRRRAHLLNEIRAQHHRPLRTRVATGAGAVALAGAAILGIAAAAGAFGHAPPKLATSSLPPDEIVTLSRVSASDGTIITLPADDVRSERLKAAGYTDVTLLASRGTHNFFRLRAKDGSSCYAWGRVGADWPLGVVACSRVFPSASRPLLDMSTVGADATGGSGPDSRDVPLRFIDLAGIAADGVAAVQGLDPSGNVVVTVPVSNNVYFEPSDSVPDDVQAIQAIDAAGRIIDFQPR